MAPDILLRKALTELETLGKELDRVDRRYPVEIFLDSTLAAEIRLYLATRTEAPDA